MAETLHRIGITLGDPAGVGPEITCKALADLAPAERERFTVFGSRAMLERADAFLGTRLSFSDAPQAGAVRVSNIEVPGLERIANGRVSPEAGEAAYRAVVAAVAAAQAGDIAAIVTAPLNKEGLHAAGHNFEGHTELLGHLTGTKQTFMLLTSEKFSTLHVSTHVSLAGAVQRCTLERVLATVRIGHRHFTEMGVAAPRIAVAGLNPHCGEHGLFGREDMDILEPAVAAARAEGMNVVGPIPADTVFYRAMNGEFDLVIAQYHDQGHIPAKLVAFDTTVNVTLGLPIRRASVDHGTAYDIAWTGRARHVNMHAAIAYARRMAQAAGH